MKKINVYKSHIFPGNKTDVTDVRGNIEVPFCILTDCHLRGKIILVIDVFCDPIFQMLCV